MFVKYISVSQWVSHKHKGFFFFSLKEFKDAIHGKSCQEEEIRRCCEDLGNKIEALIWTYENITGVTPSQCLGSHETREILNQGLQSTSADCDHLL